jgi:hypothetical protein
MEETDERKTKEREGRDERKKDKRKGRRGRKEETDERKIKERERKHVNKMSPVINSFLLLRSADSCEPDILVHRVPLLESRLKTIQPHRSRL